MVHLFAVAMLLLSQQLDTSIFGTVRDDTGAPLPGAAVSIQTTRPARMASLRPTETAAIRLPRSVVFSAASSSPAPTAGIITSTATTSRQIQFGLKLLLW
jgi:hypothetical protein